MKGAKPFAMTRDLGSEALVRPGWIRHRSNRSRSGRGRTPTDALLAAGLMLGLLLPGGYRYALGQPSEAVVAADRTQPNPRSWSQFRGPNGQGVAPAAGIPLHFVVGSNVVWKLAIPPGHSSPVSWDHPGHTKGMVF